MEIRFDMWLDNEGKAFGEECLRLLEAVDRTGSLWDAAAEANLSYCSAVKIIKESEEMLGFALTERKISGPPGEGSCLTAQGREFAVRYRLFRDEMLAIIRRMCASL